MRPATALLLARPAAGVDRARFTVMATASAGAGALLLAAARITALPAGAPRDEGLAPYVTQDGLRPGVVAGALLLTVPVLALAGQALRVGSGARGRRMAVLRLAGATPADSRVVAATETGAAALVGAVLAGPAYLLLWVAVGLLPMAGLRMMPSPARGDLVVWAVLVPVTTVAGAVAGYRLQQVSDDAVTVNPGSRRVAPSWVRRLLPATGALLVVGGVIGLFARPADAGWPDLAVAVGALLLAYAGGPWLVRRAGRRLQRRGPAEHLLAGRRLEVDPRPAGRVVAVLMVCGAALGLDLCLVVPPMVGWLLGNPPTRDYVVFVNGFGAAGTGAAFACVVALATLVVGAADQLLEARRPLASLSALGVDEATLLRVLRRQLSAAAGPAVALGAVVGVLGLALVTIGLSGGFTGFNGWVLLVLATAATASGLLLRWLVSLVARVAVRALRRPLHAVVDPENLRAP